jgi:flagellin
MTVINTNVKSLISQNALNKNNRALSAAMEQLSTGRRINSAKDDAAGLAISSRMTSQIRGLDQAVRNGNDGISMLQTAEGALIEVTNMLQRMRELSVQSANDTYAPQDRGYLDQEFQQLKDEVHRISRATQWNGMNILDGSFEGDEGVAGKFAFQVGANEGQTVTHTLGDIGFRKAVVETQVTTAAGGGAKEAGSVSLSGSFAEGDLVAVTFKGTTSTLTVAASHIVDGDDEATLANVAGSLATVMAATAEIGTAVATDGVIAYEATTADDPLSGSVSRTITGDTAALADIQDLDILTTPNSSEALAALDVGIDTINSTRADIGAMINRLTYAVDNLTNVSQYTSASRSTIQDADYAKASSELARTQIIQQAATAVLAQANTSQQTVMKLLQ